MAKIEKSMLLLAALEHSNKENIVLHQNKHENGLKFWGIYESMHPDWQGWGELLKAVWLYILILKLHQRFYFLPVGFMG